MGLPFLAWDGHLHAVASKPSVRKGTDDWRKLRGILFDKQLAVFDSVARRIAMLCGRRGGKTRTIAALLLATACKYPGQEMSVYITLTAHHSSRMLEKWLLHLAKVCGVTVTVDKSKGQLYIVHENGHTIWLTGAKDQKEAEKLRGDGYRLAVVDEAGSQQFAARVQGESGDSKDKTLLQYICLECVGPALSDLAGTLVISGSPGIMPAGFFWEVTTGEGSLPQWETHEWTVLDNPHHHYNPQSPAHTEQSVEDFQQDLVAAGCEFFSQQEVEENKQNGVVPLFPELPWLKKASPSALREWFKHWVRDTEALCYPYHPAKNDFDGVLPQGSWYYVLGVDLGMKDHTTFVVTASRRNFPDVYYLKAYGFPDANIDAIAVEIRRLMARYPIDRVVMDEGAQGLMIADTIKNKHSLPIEAAKKKGKGAAIRLVAGGLRAGTVKVHAAECRELTYEWRTVTWNADRTDHDDACMDDRCDAALYAYREHPTYERWDENPPEVGTPEAIDHGMNREVEKRLQLADLRSQLNGADLGSRLEIMDQLRAMR